jgi:hypothetical protein
MCLLHYYVWNSRIHEKTVIFIPKVEFSKPNNQLTVKPLNKKKHEKIIYLLHHCFPVIRYDHGTGKDDPEYKGSEFRH